MAGGKAFEAEWQEYTDEATGVRVRRMTSAESDSVHPYFTSSAVTEEGDLLAFNSNRSGSWQAYALELDSGRIVQLTDEPGAGARSLCLAPIGRCLFYHAENVFKAVSLDDLKSRELFRTPAGFSAGLPSATLDGSYAAFGYCEDLPTGTGTDKIYSTMRETYYQHPRCVIMRIKAGSGEMRAMWGETEWLGHIVIHPTDPNVIMFCHEGGRLVSQRVWLLEHDATGRRPRPKVSPRVKTADHQVAYHEFWTRDGKIMVQVRSDDPAKDPSYHVQCDADGSNEVRYRLPGSIPGHFHANPANTLWAVDRACQTYADEEGTSFMGLMKPDPQRRAAELRRLCLHGTSWKTQNSHPHPSFTPDGRRVVFTSDRGGHAQVYMAPADWDSLKAPPSKQERLPSNPE